MKLKTIMKKGLKTKNSNKKNIENKKNNLKKAIKKKDPNEPGLTCDNGYKIEIILYIKKKEDQSLTNQILKDEIKKIYLKNVKKKTKLNPC
jgi:hypothetical protein